MLVFLIAPEGYGSTPIYHTVPYYDIILEKITVTEMPTPSSEQGKLGALERAPATLQLPVPVHVTDRLEVADITFPHATDGAVWTQSRPPKSQDSLLTYRVLDNKNEGTQMDRLSSERRSSAP